MKKIFCLAVLILALTITGCSNSKNSGGKDTLKEVPSGNANNISDFEYKQISKDNESDVEGIEITKYVGTSANVSIPDQIDNVPVVSIGTDAFSESEIETVILPKELKVIKNCAFLNCGNLTSIEFPESVTSLGKSSFRGTGIKEVNINVDKLNEYVFADCIFLTKVTIGKKLSDMADGCFANCGSLTDVTMEAGIEIIPVSTFEKCKVLKKFALPNSVKIIGDAAFKNCIGFEEIILSDKVEEIGAYAFENCENMKKLDLPDSFKKMYPTTFSENMTTVLNFKGKQYSIKEMGELTSNN